MRVIMPGSARAVSFQPDSRGSGGTGRTGEADHALGHVLEGVDGAAVKYLESDQVQVDGVRVLGEVDQFPDLRGVQYGLLGYGSHPGRVVEEHAHGLLHFVHVLIEGQAAGADGVLLRAAA